LNQKDNFERYPALELVADALSPEYRIKLTECVEERGVVRFVRHEKSIPRERFEGPYARFLEEIANG